MFEQETEVPIQKIEDPFLDQYGVDLYIKREDLLDTEISGNKWRKLKYNLQAAKEQGYDCLLAIGGAYSNHIAAVAAAGKKWGFKTIGLIRGEEQVPLNDTLQLAVHKGMQLHYLSREDYRQMKEKSGWNGPDEKWKEYYFLPEGGSNALAVKGCTEILDERTAVFDVICCPVGTGGTLAGIAAAAGSHQRIIGFPVLKEGEFLRKDTDELLEAYFRNSGKPGKSLPGYELITTYHFEGYAKLNSQLIEFIRSFYERTGVPLDYIYTAKMVYGVYREICQGNLQNRILLIHTGGLQGNAGMAKRYKFQSIC